MKTKQLTIGLFGFGVVGEGIYQVLQNTPSLNATIKKICIRHPEKKRNAPAELFTTDYGDILNDKEINVVVELIDDAGEALKIVSNALKKKKAVVSANKKMIAENLAELLALQQAFDTPFLYEAAVCGSIPVIRNLEEYYDNDLLDGICGIVNGSTNFILTRIFGEKSTYTAALAAAQSLGFAESDPSLDVEGIDAVNKLTILLLHGYGIVTHPKELLYDGITRIREQDAVFAAQKGWVVKLTAQVKRLPTGKIAAFVLPQFVTTESQLHGVNNEYNGVVLLSSFSDKQFLYGKGAGRFPTSSAVLSDISALRYQYRYEYRKTRMAKNNELSGDFYLKVYLGFDSWDDICKEDFQWIEEIYGGDQRQYLVGVISFEKLRRAEWRHHKEVSLIVWPEGIIGDISYREVQQRSLELAGTKRRDKTAEAISESGVTARNKKDQ